MLDPAGPAAHHVASLWWAMFFGAVGLFALVMLLLALATRRPRLMAAWSERSWLVAGGLVLPALILPPLTVYGLVIGERATPVAAGDALRVEAVGRRWQWEFAYPEHAPGNIRTATVLHIPAGRPIDVHIRSEDVIHSFWVPRLAGKMDAIPGHVNVLRIQADQPGVYRGVCAEFCGIEHTTMTFVVRAHTGEDYGKALRDALEGAPK